MSFQSLAFAVFLPLVFALHWLLPHRLRWAALLLASYIFYLSWDVRYVLFLLASTLVTFGAAILLERAKKGRRTIFVFALLVSFAALLVFKYLPFFAETATAVFGLLGVTLKEQTFSLLLPIGISFYTFQSVGYLIDVYRGDIKAERHLGYYALFVSFFPQVLSGPIGRAKDLLPQYRAERTFSYGEATDGLKRMVWGFFKKLAVADVLAVSIDKVFANLPAYRGFTLVLTAVFYALQIYCDFSGYSDIAVGTAKLLGIRLPENFDLPYFSTTLKEFWSRWHVSLSTWFRDYLYIPLGGSRVGKLRHYFNLLVTFLVSGLWHGASWSYVLWGGIHGAGQIAENAVHIRPCKKKNGLVRLLRALPVFLFVTAAWVFFRAKTLPDAIYVFTHLFTGISQPLAYLKGAISGSGSFITGGAAMLSLFVFSLLPLVVPEYLAARRGQSVTAFFSGRKKAVQWIIYIVLVCLILFVSQKGVAAAFVYAQY